jgi:SnoaL-like domain
MREGIDAMNRCDSEPVFRGMDPEIRFEHRLTALQGSFVGIADVKRWFGDLTEVFDSWRIDCEDIRDLADRVLALGTVRTSTESRRTQTNLSPDIEPNPEPRRAPPNSRRGLRNRRSQVRILSGAPQQSPAIAAPRLVR